MPTLWGMDTFSQVCAPSSPCAATLAGDTFRVEPTRYRAARSWQYMYAEARTCSSNRILPETMPTVPAACVSLVFCFVADQPVQGRDPPVLAVLRPLGLRGEPEPALQHDRRGELRAADPDVMRWCSSGTLEVLAVLYMYAIVEMLINWGCADSTCTCRYSMYRYCLESKNFDFQNRKSSTAARGCMGHRGSEREMVGPRWRWRHGWGSRECQ
eukprot:SAG22_NODE_250_length_13779_cov_6.413450_7_plen_213_part_00